MTKPKQLAIGELNRMPPSATKGSLVSLCSLNVAGYKSLSKDQSIEIKPLTILAGPNSSGKSSIMQPLLLLKQTLEATYDPGALLLYGPNVRFTSTAQILSRTSAKDTRGSFRVGFKQTNDAEFQLEFVKQRGNKGFKIETTAFTSPRGQFFLRAGMRHDQLVDQPDAPFQRILDAPSIQTLGTPKYRVQRDRCFLSIDLSFQNGNGEKDSFFSTITDAIYSNTKAQIMNMIHLPGLRGNPERAYAVTAVGSTFPGRFDQYVASVVASWQDEKKTDLLRKLGTCMESLGLTWKVEAKSINDAQVELRVGRLPRGAKAGVNDTVNIADVGFGTSQTLPVVVALLSANPGQLVYLEQPEIHLHPRAQFVLANIIADAAKRGVRVVLETHSSLLIQGIQIAVAKGSLDRNLVKLHWFSRRSDDGTTEVSSADLAETGAFGDWPSDFDDVNLTADTEYLNAAEQRIFGQGGK